MPTCFFSVSNERNVWASQICDGGVVDSVYSKGAKFLLRTFGLLQLQGLMNLLKVLLVFVLTLCGVCSANHDVSSVLFRGDCTGFGMKIEGVYQADGAFLVTTTGARFEYAAGELKIYQGLGSDIGRRLVATMTVSDVNEFEKVESNDDHALFWSEKLNIGIYGDSTCIIAPKEKLGISFEGNFKPDYEGRYKGELLLIDDLGGMEIYPQRYETGYEVKKLELGKKDWIAEYLLNANERVMIAAFPGRHFDWEKSFECNVVITTGGFGPKHPFAFGVMPPDDVIEKWSKFLDIIAVHWNGLWRAGRPHGPYIVGNEPELKRLLNTAHKNKMKVIVHCSLFYFYRKHRDIESFYEQVKDVHEKYGTDGVYIDGLMFDLITSNLKKDKIDNKIANWEMIRRLRQLFGPDGVIVYHGTSMGIPVATVPNIDSYCDATHYGEAVPFKSVNDPYVKYQVRKYGISNTVAMWLDDKRPSYISPEEIIDALIKMNGREWWNGYVFWRHSKINNPYAYYLKKLKKLRQEYLARSQLNRK